MSASLPRSCLAFALSLSHLTFGACESAHRSARPPANPGMRLIRDMIADTLWIADALDSAGTGAPETIAADSANVYVGDQASRRVFALDARTGHVRWSSDRSGDTALADIRPALLTASRGGGVMVYDWTRAALLVLQANGNVVRRVTFGAPSPMNAVCELPDSSILIGHEQVSGGVLALDRLGHRVGYHRLPWQDLVREPNLVTQFSLAPTARGCLLTLNLGRGFAEFSGGAFRDTVAYVEHMAPPRFSRVEESIPDGVRVTTTLLDHAGAANGVASTDRDIVMAFGGHTLDRSHLLDVYDLDGRYRESFRTSGRVGAIAASGSSLYTLTYRDGRPVVVALRWPPRDTAHTR